MTPSPTPPLPPPNPTSDSRTVATATSNDKAASSAHASGGPVVSRWQSLWSTLQLLIALAITVAVLVYLLWVPPAAEEVVSAPPRREQVEVSGPKQIRVQADAVIAKKLYVVRVEPTSVTTPVLRVTGTVLASRRPGRGKADFWQFDSTELLTAFADWEKAEADVAFAETQLERVKELVASRNTSQAELVARLEKLVKGGSQAPKELKLEETNLRQFEIQGRKEIHEAETAVKLARRSQAVLTKQIQQTGLDTEFLRTATADMDVVSAEVPEGRSSRAALGQACEARFFGFPNQVFSGKITSLAPVLSKDRRTLRVLFTIDDPDDLLRPGMFAEIGLGTDPRDVLRVPSEGVVHIGRDDFVLTQTSSGEWRVTPVEIGELIGDELEVLKGVKHGDEVMGQGAILLKPFIVRALRTETTARKSLSETRR